MAKIKNKAKKNFADRVKEKTKKSTNPFEVHVNRQKFSVIGRTLKHDQGLPGIARSKAFKKRKATLLHEYQVKNKNNKFVDRRIGERNRFMSDEEKLTARFAAERMKAHKKSIYNLADEEILTHRGHALSEIEKFDDPKSDDDEDESGKLDAKFVKEAHFGGLLKKKEETESQAKSRKDLIDQLIAESKKRRYEKQKMQDETLELTDKLDTQWKDLLPLVSLGNSEPPVVSKPETEVKNEPAPKERVKVDPYDLAVQELKFEARGRPSEKLKTEEEIAMEEKERLEKLEAERQRRMHGVLDEVPSAFKYRSADDLDDGLIIESDIEEDKHSAEEGEGTEEIKNLTDMNEIDSDSGEENAESDKDGQSEEEDESDEDSLLDLVLECEDGEENNEAKNEIETNKNTEKSDEEASSTDVKPSTKKNRKDLGTKEKDKSKTKKKNSNTEEELTSEKEEVPPKNSKIQISNDASPGKKSILHEEEVLSKDAKSPVKKRKDTNGKEECSSDEEDLISPVKKIKKGINAKNESISSEVNNGNTKLSPQSESVSPKNDDDSFKTSEKIRSELLRRKNIMEAARKELPYTFEVPDTSDGMSEIMKGLSPDHQSVVLERMIKCTHPSLKSGNKERLEHLFGLLIQHLHDSAWATESQRSPAGQPPMSLPAYCFAVLESITPHLYDLAQSSPKNAAYCISEVLKEKFVDLRKEYPGLDTLVYLKLIPQLFPASDFRHPVCTPTIMFMTHILRSCKVKTRQDIATGLFVSTIMLECTSLSKRYSPEVVNFLLGILYMAVPKAEGLPIPPPPPPPFKSDSIDSNLLVTVRDPFRAVGEVPELMLEIDDLDEGQKKMDSSFKVRALSVACRLTLCYINQLKDLLSRKEIFQQFLSLVTLLPLDIYSKPLVETIKTLENALNELIKDDAPLEKLAHAAKRPKALKLYEPAIVDVFDGQKRKSMSRENMEREKLVHKYKKEMKGAIREIRRDKDFLAKVKVKETLRNDMERMEKVKEIFGSAATQLGEIRKLKRKS